MMILLSTQELARLKNSHSLELAKLQRTQGKTDQVAYKNANKILQYEVCTEMYSLKLNILYF